MGKMLPVPAGGSRTSTIRRTPDGPIIRLGPGPNFGPGRIFLNMDRNNSSLSGSTRDSESSTVTLNSPPLPSVVTPSPITESSLLGAAADAQESPSPLPQPIAQDPQAAVAPVEPHMEPTIVNAPESADSESEAVTLPSVVTPSIAESPLNAAADAQESPSPLPQPIARDTQAAVAPAEPHIEPAVVDAPEPADSKPEAITHSSVVTPSIAESPLHKAAAQAEETVGPSPPAQPITSSDSKPKWSARMGSVMRRTSSFDVVQDIQAVAPVEPHIESVTLNAPDPPEPEGIITDLLDEPTYFDEPIAEIIKGFEPVKPVDHVDNTAEFSEAVHGNDIITEALVDEPVDHVDNTAEFREAVHENDIITEALVDEPTSYFDEPMAKSVRDFEPVDHADDMAEFSGNANDISPEPRHEQNGEAAEYYCGDNIPTTGEVVPENANVVLPEPNSGQREELDAHDDAVPVVTEPETQEEPQQKTEPISIPVLIPVPNHSMTFGSKREIWSGEHDHGAYPSSVPGVNPSSEDVERAERSPAPNIGFVDCILFRELVPKSNPH